MPRCIDTIICTGCRSEPSQGSRVVTAAGQPARLNPRPVDTALLLSKVSWPSRTQVGPSGCASAGLGVLNGLCCRLPDSKVVNALLAGLPTRESQIPTTASVQPGYSILSPFPAFPCPPTGDIRSLELPWNLANSPSAASSRLSGQLSLTSARQILLSDLPTNLEWRSSGGPRQRLSSVRPATARQ